MYIYIYTHGRIFIVQTRIPRCFAIFKNLQFFFPFPIFESNHVNYPPTIIFIRLNLKGSPPLRSKIFQAKRIRCFEIKQLFHPILIPELIRTSLINLNEARVTVCEREREREKRPFFWEMRRLLGSRNRTVYNVLKREREREGVVVYQRRGRDRWFSRLKTLSPNRLISSKRRR